MSGPTPVGFPPPHQPPTGNPGGYTLPPTVAYFPVTAYSNSALDKVSKETAMMSQESLNQQHQPNTPDLLMHRRQVMHSTLLNNRLRMKILLES